MDLALNNLQRLICLKPKQTNNKQKCKLTKTKHYFAEVCLSFFLSFFSYLSIYLSIEVSNGNKSDSMKKNRKTRYFKRDEFITISSQR